MKIALDLIRALVSSVYIAVASARSAWRAQTDRAY